MDFILLQIRKALALFLLSACPFALSQEQGTIPEPPPPEEGIATFGMGCFWCTEAIFQKLKGVETVVSGFSRGVEVSQIAYDPKTVSYDELLEVFWYNHDPTTVNRQGNDVGPQYRSAIFYHSARQKELAEQYKKKLEDSHIWPRPIVTEILAYEKFKKASEVHQDYYNKNPENAYCVYVIRPKLEKFKKLFKDKVKE